MMDLLSLCRLWTQIIQREAYLQIKMAQKKIKLQLYHPSKYTFESQRSLLHQEYYNFPKAKSLWYDWTFKMCPSCKIAQLTTQRDKFSIFYANNQVNKMSIDQRNFGNNNRARRYTWDEKRWKVMLALNPSRCV